MAFDGERDVDDARERNPLTPPALDEPGQGTVSNSVAAPTMPSAGDSDLAESGDATETATDSANSAGPRPKAIVKRRKPAKKPVIKPQTITELFQYVYRETGTGRRLNLSRNLWDLHSTPAEGVQEAAAEIRRLARKDPFLDALANLMMEIADVELKDSVRRQILQFAQVAFASHELFEGRIERLVEPSAEPILTANEISHAAGVLRLAALDEETSLALSGAKRERLRVNAVTAFELFRVMRGHWGKDQLIKDFCDLVWRVPSRFQAPERSDDKTPKRTDDLPSDEASVKERAEWRTAAMLASAKSAAGPLSELRRYFQTLLQARDKKIDAVMEDAAAQRRRADRERDSAQSLQAEIEQKDSLIGALEARVADLERQLDNEQRSRFADEVNAVDDYENLRTQVIRQLSGQVNLLNDGLHALRNGSIAVADEFVDRALTKIDAEVKRLKELAE